MAGYDTLRKAFRYFNAETVQANTADSVTAAANTAVVRTLPAVVGRSNVLLSVIGSYSAAPTGGNLKVEDGTGNTIFQVDIALAGPFTFHFERPRKGTANTQMIVTLAAGSGTVVGKLNVAWRLDA